MKPELRLYLERSLRGAERNGIYNFVAAAAEIGVVRGAALRKRPGVGVSPVEAFRKQPVVLDEANSRQQTGRRHIVRADHDVFVDLHLIGIVDLRVMRFEAIWIRVIVVTLDGAIRLQRARLEHHASVPILHRHVEPCTA